MFAIKQFQRVVVQNGFKDTNVSVSCGLGTSAELKVTTKMKLVIVSDVYQNLLAEKEHFSDETWGKIEQAHIDGSEYFFNILFDIMTGAGISSYLNGIIDVIIQPDDNEAQAAARAFFNTDTVEVSVQYMSNVPGIHIYANRLISVEVLKLKATKER